MSSRLQQLCWAVQALAQPADIQLGLVPNGASRADELALVFDDASRGVRGSEPLAAEQARALEQLDGHLTAMSGRHNAAHWTDEALRTDPRWAEVRALAAAVLSAFAWPHEAPPPDTERATSAP